MREAHNPMGILLPIMGFFIKETPTLLDSYCVIFSMKRLWLIYLSCCLKR